MPCMLLVLWLITVTSGSLFSYLKGRVVPQYFTKGLLDLCTK